MLKDVVEVEPCGGCRLWLQFQDGVDGEVDLGPKLTFQGVFAPLRDPVYFARVSVDQELGTTAWPNGADWGSGSFCGRSMIWRQAYGELLGEPVGYSNFCKRLDPVRAYAQACICWMQVRQAYRDGLLQSFRTGTAFPNFDVHGALSTLLVVVPPIPLANVFARLFELGQRLDLIAQSRTLTAMRDTLLPRLISGELRVGDAERFVGKAI
jgi:hypothetical protein